MKKFIVLSGQTCVGKTDFINSMLNKYPKIKVINLDSLQIYAFFRIGTGRYENIYHQYLSGFLSPEEQLSPSIYANTFIFKNHQIYNPLLQFVKKCNY